MLEEKRNEYIEQIKKKEIRKKHIIEYTRIIKKFITKENFYNMSLKEYIEFVKLLKKREYSTHYRKKILTTVNNFMEEYYPEIYKEIKENTINYNGNIYIKQ